MGSVGSGCSAEGARRPSGRRWWGSTPQRAQRRGQGPGVSPLKGPLKPDLPAPQVRPLTITRAGRCPELTARAPTIGPAPGRGDRDGVRTGVCSCVSCWSLQTWAELDRTGQGLGTPREREGAAVCPVRRKGLAQCPGRGPCPHPRLHRGPACLTELPAPSCQMSSLSQWPSQLGVALGPPSGL